MFAFCLRKNFRSKQSYSLSWFDGFPEASGAGQERGQGGEEGVLLGAHGLHLSLLWALKSPHLNCAL